MFELLVGGLCLCVHRHISAFHVLLRFFGSALKVFEAPVTTRVSGASNLWARCPVVSRSVVGASAAQDERDGNSGDHDDRTDADPQAGRGAALAAVRLVSGSRREEAPVA